MDYTYLLVNFFTIIIPFIFSFHPKLNFHKTWYAFFPAVLLTGLFFVVWDMYFTRLGVWGFNQRYLTGIQVGNIPLEEVLFFICIPYACVFTYHSLSIWLKETGGSKIEKYFSLLLIFGLALVAIVYWERIYTSSTFLSLAVVLMLTRFYFKIGWLSRFYMVYAVLLIPFFLVNGILTGTGLEEEVVWYNPAEFMNIRIGTIPVEDIFYGAELILINLLIYHYLIKRRERSRNSGFKKSVE